MRKPALWAAALALLSTAPLAAQERDLPPAGAEGLRRRIEERFAERVRQELGLSADQMGKLRATSREFGGRRRDLEGRERALRVAVEQQLRPGVEAEMDSLARLTDDLLGVRVAYAQTFRDELADLATYLDPVQRTRLMIMRQRLIRRVQELRRERDQPYGGAGAPGSRRRPMMDR